MDVSSSWKAIRTFGPRTTTGHRETASWSCTTGTETDEPTARPCFTRGFDTAWIWPSIPTERSTWRAAGPSIDCPTRTETTELIGSSGSSSCKPPATIRTTDCRGWPSIPLADFISDSERISESLTSCKAATDEVSAAVAREAAPTAVMRSAETSRGHRPGGGTRLDSPSTRSAESSVPTMIQEALPRAASSMCSKQEIMAMNTATVGPGSIHS